MQTKEIITRIAVLTNDQLDAADRALVDAARRATSRSYAPYSHFRVGAAIRLDDGTVVTGSNQENAAYPSGTCAERTAAFYAHAQHPEVAFNTIAIAAVATDGIELDEPISPCGACRQALAEYEKIARRDAGHPVRVLLAGREKVYQLDSVASLLPLTFDDYE